MIVVKRLFLGLFLLLALALLGLLLLYWWGGQPQLSERQYVTTLTQSDIAAKESDTLRVMTYNIGWMSGMTNNRPVQRTDSLYQVHFRKAVAVLQQWQPTLLGLQEVDFDANRSGHWHQLDSLADHVDFPNRAAAVNWDKRYVPFPYWPFSSHFGRMLSGQGILSYLPIQHHVREVLPMPPSSFLYQRFYIDRLIQWGIVSWQDTSVALLNVHLEAWHQPTRQLQGRRVAQLADSLRYHHLVLVAGDFNAEPPQRLSAHSGNHDSTLWPLQERGFQSVTYQPGQVEDWMFTYSAVKPRLAIDHIFYHPAQWQPVSARVVTEIGDVSDHLPVVADFRRVSSEAPLQARENEVDAGPEGAVSLIE